MTRENKFQSQLIAKIEAMFPDEVLVLKNDPGYRQGIPDLTVLCRGRWAMLEVKRSEKEARSPEPNQAEYIDMFKEMSAYAAFVYPENEQEVLNALQSAFEA